MEYEDDPKHNPDEGLGVTHHDLDDIGVPVVDSMAPVTIITAEPKYVDIPAPDAKGWAHQPKLRHPYDAPDDLDV